MNVPKKVDVEELRRDLHKRGYNTVNKGGHYHVIKPDGTPLRTKAGRPITLPSTSGDWRAAKNSWSWLRDAGVFDRKEDKMAGGDSETARRNREQKKQLAHVLRERLKKVMIDYDLRQTDVYHFGEALSDAREIPRPVGTQTLVSGFLKNPDSFLTPTNYEWLKATVDEIEKREGIPKFEQGIDYRFSENKPQQEEPEEPEEEPDPEPQMDIATALRESKPEPSQVKDFDEDMAIQLLELVCPNGVPISMFRAAQQFVEAAETLYQESLRLQVN